MGADFHGAMVATAPGEKLNISRRPVRNWTCRAISSLFLCRKLHLFLGKSTINVVTMPPELHFLTPICIKPFDSSPPDRLAIYRWASSKERGEEERTGKEGREGGRRVGERREGERKGSSSFALGRKKRSLRLRS